MKALPEANTEFVFAVTLEPLVAAVSLSCLVAFAAYLVFRR